MNKITENVELWLVAGQSNIDGRVSLYKCRPTWLPTDNTVPNISMFNYIKNKFDKWQYLNNTGSSIINDSHWAFDSTAIYYYSKFSEKKQFVVKTSLGGTSIGINPSARIENWNCRNENSLSGIPQPF